MLGVFLFTPCYRLPIKLKLGLVFGYPARFFFWINKSRAVDPSQQGKTLQPNIIKGFINN